MKKTASAPAEPPAPGPALRHREAQIVAVLLKVCGRLERMEDSAAARNACRTVARRLATLLMEENGEGREGR